MLVHFRLQHLLDRTAFSASSISFADLMSYSSSSIPMMFFLPSLIGSLFRLPIINQPPVLIFLFYHSLLIFYRLFFGGSQITVSVVYCKKFERLFTVAPVISLLSQFSILQRFFRRAKMRKICKQMCRKAVRRSLCGVAKTLRNDYRAFPRACDYSITVVHSACCGMLHNLITACTERFMVAPIAYGHLTSQEQITKIKLIIFQKFSYPRQRL